MSDKSSEHYSERVTLTHRAYVKLWASLQGALHPYTKDLMPLVERSLVDPRFRDQMLQDPDAVFKEAGVVFSEGVRLKVVEDSQETRYLVLPPPVETIPKKRMDLFNSMLTSGTLIGQWGQDDSNMEDNKKFTDPKDHDADFVDPGKDDWHPF